MHVGKHIFEHVLGKNGMLKKAARILVTHGLHHLTPYPDIDLIVMKNGKIAERGKMEKLRASQDSLFGSLLRQCSKEEKKAKVEQEQVALLEPGSPPAFEPQSYPTSPRSTSSRQRERLLSNDSSSASVLSADESRALLKDWERRRLSNRRYRLKALFRCVSTRTTFKPALLEHAYSSSPWPPRHRASLQPPIFGSSTLDPAHLSRETQPRDTCTASWFTDCLVLLLLAQTLLGLWYGGFSAACAPQALYTHACSRALPVHRFASLTLRRSVASSIDSQRTLIRWTAVCRLRFRATYERR